MALLPRTSSTVARLGTSGDVPEIEIWTGVEVGIELGIELATEAETGIEIERLRPPVPPLSRVCQTVPIVLFVVYS